MDRESQTTALNSEFKGFWLIAEHYLDNYARAYWLKSFSQLCVQGADLSEIYSSFGHDVLFLSTELDSVLNAKGLEALAITRFLLSNTEQAKLLQPEWWDHWDDFLEDASSSVRGSPNPSSRTHKLAVAQILALNCIRNAVKCVFQHNYESLFKSFVLLNADIAELSESFFITKKNKEKRIALARSEMANRLCSLLVSSVNKQLLQNKTTVRMEVV